MSDVVRNAVVWFDDEFLEEGKVIEALDAEREAHKKEIEHLHGQIDPLAKVLLEEFGGPTCNESACEMAVRLLRGHAKEVADLRKRIEELTEQLQDER